MMRTMGQCEWVIQLLMLTTVYTYTACMNLISSCGYKEIQHLRSVIVTCSNITAIPDNLPLNTTELHIEHGTIATLNIDSIHGLTEIQSLKVEYSGLFNITENAFNRFPTLKMISLKGNNIVFLPNSTFSKLQNIENIDLSENRITQVDELFSGLHTLGKLSLYGNRISHISKHAFKDLTFLHHLELHENIITDIEPLTFAANKNVMVLSLGANPLSNLSALFPHDMILQYLNMTKCQLQSIPKDLPPSLKFLQLSDNKIRHISRTDIEAYVNLNALVLGKNGLVSIEQGALTALKSLTDIFLFVNNLKTIPGPFPASIRSIHLDNNNITEFDPTMFQNGTTLTVLSLRSNKIDRFPFQAFENFKSIKELHLEGNPLTMLPERAFSSLKGLQYLNLNRIESSLIIDHCFEGLTELKKLDMSYVKGLVFGNVFLPLVKLEELQLQESPVLAGKLVQYLGQGMKIQTLQELNLMDNGLTTLNSNLQKNLPNIGKLSISGNNLVCDEELLWIKKWQAIEPEKFFMFDQVRCHTPRHLHGQRISDVPVWEFSTNSTSSNDLVTSDIQDYYVETSTEPDAEVSTHYYFDKPTDYPSWYQDYDDDDFVYEEYDNYNYQTLSTVTIHSSIDDFSSSISLTSPKSPSSSATVTMDTNDVMQPPALKPTNPQTGSELKAVGIAIAMSFGVIFVMLALSFIIYKLWQRKQVTLQQNGRNHCEEQDYVFVATHNNKPEPKPPRKLSRTERGSTTSRASEDITNQTDLDMKVYMLDVDA